MANVTYKIKEYSKSFLQKLGFKYSGYLSEYGDEVYVNKFPLISYSKITTIECEIAISVMTGIVNINVYSSGTKELYAPYYNREHGEYETVSAIDLKINKKLKELGIEKI